MILTRLYLLLLAPLAVALVAACHGISPTAPSVRPLPVVLESTPVPEIVPLARPFTVNLIVGPSNPTVGDRVAFTAQAPAELPALPASYDWTFGDGSTRTTDTDVTYYTYTLAGLMIGSVTVTDAAGKTANAEATVQVSNVPPPPPPPSPPPPTYAVSISANPNPVVANNPTTLTVTATPQHGASAATSFHWDCNADGTPEATTTINVRACSFPTAGTHTPYVTATGPDARGSGSVNVIVLAQAPLFVMITADDYTPAIGQSVTFTATVTSSGPLPATMRWQWDDLNDGTYEIIMHGPSPQFRTTTYGSVGVKTMKVLVNDPPTGREASSVAMVTVGP